MSNSRQLLLYRRGDVRITFREQVRDLRCHLLDVTKTHADVEPVQDTSGRRSNCSLHDGRLSTATRTLVIATATNVNCPEDRSQLSTAMVLHALFSTATSAEFERCVQYADLAPHHLRLNLLQYGLAVLER
jgi:hypothetical protein